MVTPAPSETAVKIIDS
jgi:hypothetical protein